jgi:hypothetical protein
LVVATSAFHARVALELLGVGVEIVEAARNAANCITQLPAEVRVGLAL